MSHHIRSLCPVCGSTSRLQPFYGFSFLNAQPQFARFQMGEGKLTAEGEQEPFLICQDCHALTRAFVIDYDDVHDNYKIRHGAQSADEIAAHVESEFKLLSDPGYAKYRFELSIIEASLADKDASQSTLLDIGSREGVLVRALRSKGYNARIVEPTRAFTEVLESRFEVPCTTALFGPDLFPPESFDLITALHVLHRADDPSSFAAAVAKQLRPGGTFITAVSSLYDINWCYMTQQHRVIFTPSTICRLLERHGLKIQSVRPVICDGTARQFVVARKTEAPGIALPPLDKLDQLKVAAMRAEFGLLPPVRGSFAQDAVLLAAASLVAGLLGSWVVPHIARLLRVIDRRIGRPEPTAPELIS